MYFETLVEFTVDVDRKNPKTETVSVGKTKVQRVAYLVDAMTCTEAEAKITAYLVKQSEKDFFVKSAKESKISAVV